ncbi:MAG: hypothetical protein AMJ90_08575 [candidate division Zixibacteria bacterium SM23_73_2]|nr:MAG: hypothetical protein AMJ90_08575 [candidate division Zixibacteria bacterium SM23_73_2]
MTKEKRISRIESQKKNQKRISVFLDGEFAFGLDQETFFRFGLKKGDILNKKKLNQILDSEKKIKVKNAALNFLSYRARSEKEIKDRLKRKGYSRKLIDEVISDLKRLNFLNDYQFALNWIKDRLDHKPRGEKLLRAELLKLGIKEEFIEKSLEEAYPKNNEKEIALGCPTFY